MDIAVGSTNPVKRRATEGVFEGAAVEAVAVESEVRDQPMSHEETIAGARTRARSALDAGAFDLGVGIEGGVAGLPSDAGDGLFLVMWTAITDSERLELGGGPSIRLPSPIERAIENGAELGPLLDECLGTDGLAERQGAIGVFTGGAIGREDALRAAVACAAGPFRTDRYLD